MYVKVYISRMEMTKNLLKITIFWENGQKGQKKFRTDYKTQFWVKNAKVAWKSS